MALTYDVIIIGGGIVGVALARELSRYDVATILVERHAEVGFGMSKANSGIVHAGAHSSPAKLKGQLEWPGNRAWARLHGELGFGYRQVGELIVALDAKDLATLDKLRQRGEHHGVPGLEIWPAERVHEAEPAVTRDVVAALWAPTAAVFNPYEAVLMLADSAAVNGVEIAVDHPVVAIDPPGVDDDTLVVRTGPRPLRGRFVVNAAGMYADAVAAMAGVPTFAIHPRKGEEYILDKRAAGLVSRVIFPCPTPTTKGTLVIPTVDGTIMVGPTAEEVSDREDRSTTPEGEEAVFASARRLVPAVDRRDVIAEFAGVRAVADTDDFVIGPTTRRGFVNAAGIQSPGLTAAPAIAELLVTLLADEGLDLQPREGWVAKLQPPVRFAELSTNDQAQLAAGDPRFARLVCRCEHVTEAEVINAMRRGACTLDGVKFRTRAGMGRCQGGFCTWRTMQLLADHHGVDVSEVTKRGGGSWIACSRDTLDGASTSSSVSAASP